MARKRFRMKKKKRRKKRRRPAVDDFPMNPGWRTGGGGCARTNQLYTPVSSPFPIPSPLFFLSSSNLFCLAFRLEEEIFGKRNSRRRGKEREVSSDKFHLLAIILLGVGG